MDNGKARLKNSPFETKVARALQWVNIAWCGFRSLPVFNINNIVSLDDWSEAVQPASVGRRGFGGGVVV